MTNRVRVPLSSSISRRNIMGVFRTEFKLESLQNMILKQTDLKSSFYRWISLFVHLFLSWSDSFISKCGSRGVRFFNDSISEITESSSVEKRRAQLVVSQKSYERFLLSTKGWSVIWSRESAYESVKSMKTPRNRITLKLSFVKYKLRMTMLTRWWCLYEWSWRNQP